MRIRLRRGSSRHAYHIGDLDADPFAADAAEVIPDRAPDGVRRRSYDKAFEPAVAEGFLTVHAAWARGSRDAYSIGLQRRYQLTSELACEVADNRMPLIEALEILDRRAEGAFPELTGMRTPVLRQLLPLAAALLLVLFPIVNYGQRLWQRQARIGRSVEQLSFASIAKRNVGPASQAPAATPRARAQVERDEAGRVTRVSAGRPRLVLEEICRLAASSPECGWMEVRESEPHYPGLRIGRFATTDGGGEIWAVRIRRNRSNGRWSVGTGLRPLEPKPDGEFGLRGGGTALAAAPDLAAHMR